jgi:hypothetical protein
VQGVAELDYLGEDRRDPAAQLRAIDHEMSVSDNRVGVRPAGFLIDPISGDVTESSR